MNNTKFRIPTLVSTLLILVFSLVDNIILNGLYGHNFTNVEFFSAITPVLFVVSLVLGYFGFKDTLTFQSKWTWVFISLYFSTVLSAAINFPHSIFVSTFNVLYVISALLYLLGTAAIFASVLLKRFSKIMPIGFGILVLERIVNAITYKSFSITTLLVLVLYTLFVLMSLGIFEKLNKYFRLAVIILAVICVQFFGFNAITFIVLAFLIVPGGKVYSFIIPKIVALICVVAAIASFISFFYNEPFGSVKEISDRIESTNDEISNLKEDIKQYQSDLENKNADLALLEADLAGAESKRDNAQKDLINAENALSHVCYRSYYSWFYCDNSCLYLHEAVEECEEIYDDCQYEVDNISYDINSCEYDIGRLQNSIAYATDSIEGLKDSLPEMRVSLVSCLINALVALVAVIISAAGLVILAICLFKETYGKKALLCAALTATGAFIFMILTTSTWAFYKFDLLNYPIYRFVLNPNFWTIVFAALFSVIIVKKEAGSQKLPIYRFFAALSAAIIFITSAAYSSPVLYALFAISLIAASFVIVPIKFTEYNNIAKHIFFTLITCGIWQFIWIFNLTKNLNKVSGVDARKPWVELLLCIFLPFYYIYWVYKTAEYVEAYGSENGKQFKISILCLVLSPIFPISTSIIQDKINRIVGKPE